MAPQYPGYTGIPAPKRGSGWIITRVIVGLVSVGVAVTAVTLLNKSNTTTPTAQPTFDIPLPQAPDLNSPTTSPATVAASTGPMALPASGGGLVLLTDSLGQAEAKRVQTGLAKGGAAYTNALIGSYGPTAGGNYRVVLVAQPFTNLDPASQAQIEGGTPTAFVSQVISGMKLPSISFQPSKDPNAAIACGPFAAAGPNTVVCVWTDAESFGLTYFYGTYYTTSITDAGTYTDALRAAAEGS